MAKLTRHVTRWMDAELARDAALQARVARRINELKLEEDLVALRETRGLTQAQLGKLLGVSQPAIAKIESGAVKNLQMKTLVRLVTALGGRLEVAVRDPRGRARRASRAVARRRRVRVAHKPKASAVDLTPGIRPA
jgi:transcriptional regulator with XRE-family HTH domain